MSQSRKQPKKRQRKRNHKVVPPRFPLKDSIAILPKPNETIKNYPWKNEGKANVNLFSELKWLSIRQSFMVICSKCNNSCTLSPKTSTPNWAESWYFSTQIVPDVLKRPPLNFWAKSSTKIWSFFFTNHTQSSKGTPINFLSQIRHQDVIFPERNQTLHANILLSLNIFYFFIFGDDRNNNFLG